MIAFDCKRTFYITILCKNVLIRSLSQPLNFTEEQKKAIQHSKGHLRIIACPGSGKTEVVSRRVSELIKNGVDPETIVSFTFTEKAANELKTRIRRILEWECPQRADFGDMYVGTIHSFCFKILKEIEPRYRSYDVLDDAMRVAFLNKYENYYEKVKIIRFEKAFHLRHYETIDRFLYSADIMMTEDVDLRKMADTRDNKRFIECYQAYRDLLDEEKYFDFSSIIQTVVHLLRSDPEKLQKVHNLVKHVTVDEYQDLNQMQENLVDLLSKAADSVCVVGDDDQNIYHWRGSNVKFIRDFAKKYSKNYDVTTVELGINYRSTDALVSTTRGFVEHSKSRITKSMKHNDLSQRKFEEGDIICNEFQIEKEEYDFVARRIKELLGTDHVDKRNRKYALSLGDFAILVRTNDDASRITSHLKENGLECVAYSGTSVFNSHEVELAIDCISYVFGCPGYTNGGGPVSMQVLKDGYNTVFPTAVFPKASASQFEKKIETIKQRAAKIVAKAPRDYLGGLGLQEFFHNILNAMGAEDFDFGKVINYNLAVLSGAISDYEKVYQRLRAAQVQGFIYFVFGFARSHYSETVHSDPTIQDAVKVLTIHKAKGLEFPVVFVPGFVEPRKSFTPESFVDREAYDISVYEGTEDDQMRIYYTAFTRAEKYLFISSPGARLYKRGRKMSRKMHHFVEDIPDTFVSKDLYSKRVKNGLEPRKETEGTFPTSYTHLNSYERCPNDFLLRHIYSYNAGVPPGFGYGTNIHNMLNVIFNNYIERKTIPTNEEIRTMFDRMFKLRYAPGTMADNMRAKAEEIVRNYVELYRKDFERVLKTEKGFEFVIGDALIAGQIDLLLKVDENKRVTDVEIIDFKSEEKVDGEYQTNHEKQLRFYAIACLESLGLHPERAWVHHLSEVDPAKAKSQVDISKQKLDETKKEIEQRVEEILSRDYKAKPRKGTDTCKECDYKILCPFKNFKSGISFTN